MVYKYIYDLFMRYTDKNGIECPHVNNKCTLTHIANYSIWHRRRSSYPYFYWISRKYTQMKCDTILDNQHAVGLHHPIKN